MKNGRNFAGSIETSLIGRVADESTLQKPAERKITYVSQEEKERLAAYLPKPGRPSNASMGLVKRKQYSVTLEPEFRDKVMRYAKKKGCSFAVLIETALQEYMDRHKI